MGAGGGDDFRILDRGRRRRGSVLVSAVALAWVEDTGAVFAVRVPLGPARRHHARVLRTESWGRSQGALLVQSLSQEVSQARFGDRRQVPGKSRQPNRSERLWRAAVAVTEDHWRGKPHDQSDTDRAAPPGNR